MPAEIDYYAVLGVGRDATPDEIRGAYRRAARASHPDLHPGDASATARFQRVQVAYEILGDPASRAAYDRPPEQPIVTEPAPPPTPTRGAPRRYDPDDPVSLARELGETVRAIRVHARRAGFARRVKRLIRYLEGL